MKDVHVRIADEINDAVDLQAARERRSRAEVISEAVALYVCMSAKAERKGRTIQPAVERAMSAVKGAK